MSKSSAKEILDYIEKYGRGRPPPKPGAGYVASPTPAPSTKAPAGATHAPPKPGQHVPSGGGSASSPAIKDMQEKLVGLSKLVLSQLNIENIAKQDDLRQAGEAAHRDSFGDFVVKNYLRPAGGGAQEFDPSERVTDVAKKQPSTPTRMYSIMNTMSRIGGPKAEFKPDGVWGPRTNQALHNTKAFAEAMLKLSKDFETPVKSYTLSDLKNFALPDKETDLSPQDRAKSASVLAQHIRAITNMFHEIKENILENPQHQASIEGDTPYAVIGKGKEKPGAKPEQAPQPLTPQAIASLQTRFKDGFPILFTDPQTNKGKTVLVFVQDLVSPDAFQGWMYKQQTNQDPAKIIEQVKDRLAGRPIKPLPRRYEDTLSPTDREQFFKRNPDLKKQYNKEVAEEAADQAKQEQGMAQQRTEMSGKAGA